MNVVVPVDVVAYAKGHDLASVAVPAIGMGTAHLDAGLGARVFADVLAEHAASGATAPRRVRVVPFTAFEDEAFHAVFASDARFAPDPSAPST